MAPREQNSYIKLFILTGLVILVVGVVFAVFTNLQRRDKIKIEIRKVPSDTTIFVNDKKTNGTLYLKPGTYKIRGEREGFTPYTYDITLSANTPRDPLFFGLAPSSAEAKKWATEHSADYQELEAIGGQLEAEKNDKIYEKYPIINKLPYRGSLYNIDYFLNEAGEFRVQISSPDALGRQVATETIRSWGYEPSDYVVEFVDLQNPFVPQTGGASDE